MVSVCVTVGYMVSKMMEKFDKYWLFINGFLVIGAILDFRNKLECVELYFDEIYGYDVFEEVERVKNLLDDLLDEYYNVCDGSGLFISLFGKYIWFIVYFVVDVNDGEDDDVD